MKRLVSPIVILLSGVLGSFAAGLAFTATASRVDAEAASRFRPYLQNRAKSPAFSAAILVVSKGKVVIREAHGMADFELGVPLQPDHVFRIGSLTKPFTAAAILRLRDQGRLKLSQSVCEFIHPCPTAWRPATVAHLLSHTSGLPDLFGDLEAVPAAATCAEVDRVVGKAGALAPQSSAGSEYSYSNFNYVLLGCIIEAVTGETWEAFLQAQVLAPAGMTDTRYDDVWAVVPRRVHGYEMKDGQLRITRYTDHAAYAAGGLRSTLDDLRRWHEAYRAGSILSRATVEEALRPGLGNYGYGWQTTTHFGRRVHNHTGGLRGFASHLAFYPDEELLIVILSNIEDENTKGTACDIAALALGVASVPTGTPDWIQHSNGERCGAP
jgi:CubicO group peptidase (beta-lactamase class C family)